MYRLRPHDPVRPRLLRARRAHRQSGGFAREPQRGDLVRQGRRAAAVGLSRGASAHAPQAGGASRIRADGAHLLGGGTGHHRREPEQAEGGERTRIGGLLLRLSQAPAALPDAIGLAVRLPQLLHRVQRLLPGHGHGLAPRLRADGGARHGQHQVPAGVDRQPVLLPHPGRPGLHGRQGAGREVHRRRPAPVAHRGHRRYPPPPASRHRRSPGSGDGQHHHQRGCLRPAVRVGVDAWLRRVQGLRSRVHA